MCKNIHAMLTDIATWAPLMRQLAAPAIQAIRYTPTPTTHAGSESQPERATRAQTRLDRDLTDLHTIAVTLADENPHPSDDLETIRLHAPALAAWPDLLETLTAIHARWKNACDPDTTRSDWLCPACGTTRLHWAHARRLYVCPACHYAGTPAQAAAMRAWTIRQSDTWLTRTQACAIFGLTREALKKHIQRGHLHPDQDGLLHTSELRGLPRR